MKYLLSFLISTTFLFPQYKDVQKEVENLNLESFNYLLYSVEADEVIAAHNNDQELSAASINKVLTTYTAISLLDENDLQKEITLTSEMFGEVPWNASIAGFYPGQVLTIQEILYGVILSSGADATNIISHYLTGTTDGLVKEMNKMAKSLGMEKTNIVNVMGLDDTKQHTSLNDLLILLNAALENDIFYDIYTKQAHPLKHNEDFILDNHILTIMKNLNYPYIYGAKSGNTSWARFALSTIAKDKDLNYILITTQAKGYSYLDNGAIDDAMRVYDHVFKNYASETIFNEGDLKAEVKIKYRTSPYEILHLEDLVAITNKKFDPEDLTFKFTAHEDLKAPLEKDAELGTYDIYYHDELIDSKVITAHEDIPQSLIFKLLFGLLLMILGLLIAILLYWLFRFLQLEHRKNKSKY